MMICFLILLIFSDLPIRSVVGLRLFGKGGITPFQLRLKLGGRSASREEGIRFMHMLDKAKSFGPLEHLIAIPSMTYFQQSFINSCEMMSRRHLEELLGPEDHPEERQRRLQVIGIDCLSRITAFPIDVDSWDLPIRRPLSTRHHFDARRLREIFMHANSNRGLLSSTFLCRAMELKELGYWAAFMIDGPCLVSNPPLVSLLAATFGIEQRLLAEHRNPPCFPKAIAEMMQIASIMVFAGGRMNLQECGRYLFIAKTLRDALDEIGLYAASLTESERPLFELAFKLTHMLTTARSAFDFDKLKGSLKAARMLSILELYPRVCALIDGLGGLRFSTWAARLEIDTLVVLSQIHFPVSADFPLLVLHLMRRARENHVVLPVRYLMVLLWAIRLGEGMAYANCHGTLTSYILAHMTPHSDMDVFRQLDLANLLPFAWKRTINRCRDAWWAFASDLPLGTMVDGFTDILGIPPAAGMPSLPDIRRCSTEQLDQLRLVIKSQIDYFLEHHFVSTGRKRLFYGDWPIYIPLVRSPSFLLSWFWVLLYLAHTLRIRLPFHLHPLCLLVIQGDFSVDSARLLITQSLQAEYEKLENYDDAAEALTRFLQRTMQFCKFVLTAMQNPSKKSQHLHTLDRYMAFRTHLDRWPEDEPVPPIWKLEKMMLRDAGSIVEFMSPNVDTTEEFEDFLEPSEIMAILLSHPTA